MRFVQSLVVFLFYIIYITGFSCLACADDTVPKITLEKDRNSKSSILQIGDQSIRIQGPVRLTEGVIGGVDFPADQNPPAWADKDLKILDFPTWKRIPIIIQVSQDREPIWVFVVQPLRIPVHQIQSLEAAVSGLDYPADGPLSLDRNFYVVVQKNGMRIPLYVNLLDRAIEYL